MRKALNTANWELATEMARSMETGGGEKSSRTLKEFAENQGYRLLKQLDVDALREFRQHWKDGALAARKKLERMRAFFRFSVESNWIRSNPALAIKLPLLHSDPTLPLDDEELEKIHGNLRKFVAERKAAARGPAASSDHLDRLKALLLVLEHTGLRIVDAVTLSQCQVSDGRVTLRAQKNQGEINLPLPPAVFEELQRLKPYKPERAPRALKDQSKLTP